MWSHIIIFWLCDYYGQTTLIHFHIPMFLKFFVYYCILYIVFMTLFPCHVIFLLLMFDNVKSNQIKSKPNSSSIFHSIFASFYKHFIILILNSVLKKIDTISTFIVIVHLHNIWNICQCSLNSGTPIDCLPKSSFWKCSR